MKRIILAFATFGMVTAGSFAILSAGPMGAANAAVRHTSHRGPTAAARGPYASATEPAARGAAPAPSIPYDAGGPAYMPGQTKSNDFQLQH
jgi:hypothetical protein